MTQAAKTSILRRRLAPPQPRRAENEAVLEKLMRVEMPRTADVLLALQAEVRSVNSKVVTQDEIVEGLVESDMISLMTDPDDALGLIVVDANLKAAMIEIQTLGKVSTAPASERAPTRTDLVMVSDLLDRWQHDVHEAAKQQGVADALPIAGFTREQGLLGLRAVELTLDPGRYNRLRIAISLGGGAKIGTLSYFVPASLARVGGMSEDALGPKLRPHLMEAPVEMDVILTRLEKPLGEAMNFAAGDVIAINAEALGEVSLEVRALDEVIGQARLGQVKGMRAVRLGALTGAMGASLGSDAASFDLPTVKDANASIPSGGPEISDVSAAIPGDEGAAQLPDLPDLPDLPELPELPDLPELPALPDLPGP